VQEQPPAIQPVPEIPEVDLGTATEADLDAEFGATDPDGRPIEPGAAAEDAITPRQ
jgi:hypothetical protein